MDFEIPIEDFDLDLLPETARVVGSTEFESGVQQYFEGEFASLGGDVAVEIQADRVKVRWNSEKSGDSLFDRGMIALEQGRPSEGAAYLEALTAVEPKHAVAHYNLGMVLSDLGRLEKSQLHLLKAVHLDSQNSNALVALGLALYRDGNADAARRRLEQALSLDPDNGFAHRNLGAILGNLNERQAAIHHLREANRLLPNDQSSTYGLAQALEDFGGPDDLPEADTLYQTAISQNIDSQLGELARQARSRIAAKNMRSIGGTPRMDAVMYCLGALEKFSEMAPDAVQAVGFEIALKGRSGLEVNNPDILYTLRTLPGEFTGMHLMCLMFTAFQQIAPETDIGFDLSQEYNAALEIRSLRHKT